MCSCLPSFAGFFRYHLPLLRSIMSLFGSFGSKLRGLSLSKPFSQSGGSGASKKLFTKNIKVTLGSRIDGKGHFLNTGSVFAKEDHWQNLADSTAPPDHVIERKETYREYFERLDGDGVENQPTRPQRIKTNSAQSQIRDWPLAEMFPNERLPHTRFYTCPGENRSILDWCWKKSEWCKVEKNRRRAKDIEFLVFFFFSFLRAGFLWKGDLVPPLM